jgi:hypothetical protein
MKPRKNANVKRK